MSMIVNQRGVICPTCNLEGEKSCVTPNGSMKTLIYCAPFYDETCKRHHHDSNHATAGYTCTRGHRWEEKSYGSCWCGWSGEPGARTAASSREKP